MDISSNADKLARSWEKRASAISGRMHKATKEATKTLLSESKRQMKELIYDKPIPTRAEEQSTRMSRQQTKGRIAGYGSKDMGFATKGSRFGVQRGGGVAYKDLKKSGKKKAWKRTGNLQREEKMNVVSTYLGLIENRASSKTKKGKSSPYAAARHNKKNTRYPAPWRQRAIDITRPKIRKIYQDALRASIRDGIIPGGL
jgi:hypothetical protein